MQITDSTRYAILATWDSIAADAYELCEDLNEIAMEMVLDANRLTMTGYAEADLEISTLNAQYGWTAVRAALAKKIQLL